MCNSGNAVNCCNFRHQSNMALTDDVKQLLKDTEKELEE